MGALAEEHHVELDETEIDSDDMQIMIRIYQTFCLYSVHSLQIC